MLPKLKPENQLLPHYNQYLQALDQSAFDGDICTDLASRLLMATDNSIYQILPQAVLYPKNSSDIQTAFALSQQPEFEAVRFSPRGGGTGTNGQSLTPGIIIDCSRYMHHIVEINASEQWARVQPGVVLDQLNDTLSGQGLFFAPSLSPSSRATLGGMFNTDACGLGSCCYGRTSQHVLEVSCVLSDGTAWKSVKIDLSKLDEHKNIPGIIGDIHKCVDDMVTEHQSEIDARFPKLPRHMTGYNLAKVYDENRQHFSLNYLLSGSEGTLAFISELKLNLLPKPTHQTLFAIKYASFDDALRAARDLLSAKPTSIETIDDKIWRLARQDGIYHAIQPMLDPEGTDTETKAVNFVQFSGHSSTDFQQQMSSLKDVLEAGMVKKSVVGYYQTTDTSEISTLWGLRKKSVGLLANVEGSRQQLPFVEDTAVPPEKLVDYIAEFRALLESHGLQYGMFGHVDAGCLHVRPALDMTIESERNLVPIITHKVNQLVKKYGGLLWAEHGRGFRTEYTEDYFGPALLHAMRKIKTAFDPLDKLNPGKIATSLTDNVSPVKVDSPTRGHQDQQINHGLRQQFDALMHCNGNGQCFDYHHDHVICPSAKATRNRIHSPKGRASVMREWLKLLSKTEYRLNTIPTRKGRLKAVGTDFSHEVYQAMSGCLGCKACASSCPVHVDIPQVKSQFLAHYHSRYRRPVRDYVIKHSEQLAFHQSQHSWTKPLFQNKLVDFAMAKIGLTDLPKITAKSAWHQLGKVVKFNQHYFLKADSKKTICLIPDAFNACFDSHILVDTYQLLSALGYHVFILPFRTSGKAHHAKGFLQEFADIANANQAAYQHIIERNIPLIAIEPSIALCFRDEYAKVLPNPPKVLLLQEWLTQAEMNITSKVDNKAYRLFSHCSEKSLLPLSDKLWQQAFKKFGLTLNIIQTGCCGMAGSYGHEIEHQTASRQLFEASWLPKLQSGQNLATGFSCRSQAKRFANLQLQHPVSVLAAKLR